MCRISKQEVTEVAFLVKMAEIHHCVSSSLIALYNKFISNLAEQTA